MCGVTPGCELDASFCSIWKIRRKQSLKPVVRGDLSRAVRCSGRIWVVGAVGGLTGEREKKRVKRKESRKQL